MCYLCVVREVLGEGEALLFAERCEIWVRQGVVGFGEVVIALCVADAVDCCFAHVVDVVGGLRRLS